MGVRSRSDLLQGTLDLLILNPRRNRCMAMRSRSGFAAFPRAAPGAAGLAVSGAPPPREPRLGGCLWDRTDTGREAKFYKLTRVGRQQLEREVADWQRLTEGIALVMAGLAARAVMNWLRRLLGARRLERELARKCVFVESRVEDLIREGVDAGEASAGRVGGVRMLRTHQGSRPRRPRNTVAWRSLAGPALHATGPVVGERVHRRHPLAGRRPRRERRSLSRDGRPDVQAARRPKAVRVVLRVSKPDKRVQVHIPRSGWHPRCPKRNLQSRPPVSMQATIHGAAQLVTTQLVSGKLVRRHRCSSRPRPRAGGLRRSREGRATRRSDERLAVGMAIQPRRVGRRFHLMINGLAFTVAGIAEPGFRGLIVGTPSDLWIPGTAASGSTSQQRSMTTQTAARRGCAEVVAGTARPGAGVVGRTRLALEAKHQQILQARVEKMEDADRKAARFRERLSLIDGEHGLSTLRERLAPALRVLMGMSLLVLIVAAATSPTICSREAPSAAANWRSGWNWRTTRPPSSGSS